MGTRKAKMGETGESRVAKGLTQGISASRTVCQMGTISLSACEAGPGNSVVHGM